MARAKERVYQPEADEAPPRPPSGSNTALAMAVSVFAVLGLGGLVWANMGGIETAPTIKPDVESFKERGAGEEAASPPPPADRAVYDALEGNGEIARALPSEALAKAAAAAQQTDKPVAPVAPVPVAPTPAAPAASKVEPLATPAAPAASAAAGGFFIQLAALSSEAAGRALWAKVEKAAPAPGGVGLTIQASENAGASLYRVRVGPFADRAAAAAYCGQIRAKSFDCQVVKP
jgi:cell division septation protein DedD